MKSVKAFTFTCIPSTCAVYKIYISAKIIRVKHAKITCNIFFTEEVLLTKTYIDSFVKNIAFLMIEKYCLKLTIK